MVADAPVVEAAFLRTLGILLFSETLERAPNRTAEAERRLGSVGSVSVRSISSIGASRIDAICTRCPPRPSTIVITGTGTALDRRCAGPDPHGATCGTARRRATLGGLIQESERQAG